VLLLGLSGCFKSDKELIVASNADFPFTTITYLNGDGETKVTLQRFGDRYLITSEEGKDYVRFKAFGKNTYVAQLTTVEQTGLTYMFGFIRVSPDRKSFELIKGVALAADLAAARTGQPGFSVCDKDSVCIATLKDYVEYADKTPPADAGKRLQILTLE
jgi:hypothetical protein